MNQMNSCKPQFKAKVPVIILSAISWLFLSLWFVYYIFVSSSSFTYHVARFVQPLPCLLMFLFAFVFYRTRKANLFAMFVFISAAIPPFLAFVVDIFDEYWSSGIYLVWNVLVYSAIPLLILAGIFRVKGSSNKVFVIIAVVLFTLAQLIGFITDFQNHMFFFRHQLFAHGIFLLMLRFGSILLYTALLLLGLCPVKTPSLDPEQALIQLNERRSREEISDEEYQAQRAEIIHNL